MKYVLIYDDSKLNYVIGFYCGTKEEAVLRMYGYIARGMDGKLFRIVEENDLEVRCIKDNKLMF